MIDRFAKCYRRRLLGHPRLIIILIISVLGHRRNRRCPLAHFVNKMLAAVADGRKGSRHLYAPLAQAACGAAPLPQYVWDSLFCFSAPLLAAPPTASRGTKGW